MNEISHYDPLKYHISQTKSVFVQLDGTMLRLQTPKLSVAKRAMWNDGPPTNVCFIKQRHFDLSGSKVELLPTGLVLKRLWSKKYPICIILAKLGNKKVVKDPEKATKTPQFEELPQQLCHDGMLFLFARTGREKEEWYRRIEAATLGRALPVRMGQLVRKLQKRQRKRTFPHSSSTPDKLDHQVYSNLSAKHTSPSFENGMSELKMLASNTDDGHDSSSPEERILLEYLAYMARVMPPDTIQGKVVTAPTTPQHVPTLVDLSKDVKCEASVLWANSGLARLFFDFFKDEYWAGKVKDKIEKKLGKLHVRCCLYNYYVFFVVVVVENL